ncbi:MAG: lasso peptide biosynthesis B2 protein [Pseudomonadota bacterium]
MKLAQSSHVPPQGAKPRLSDLGWLVAYSVRGLLELLRARFIFVKLEPKDILTRNRAAKATANTSQKIGERELARIAYVLPRLSDRFPWRSDCLVQAIAGQNWLKSKHASSEIQIGVENPEDGDFGAHAWLMHEDQVVTGGDIERYHLLLADSRIDPEKRRRNAENEPQ